MNKIGVQKINLKKNKKMNNQIKNICKIGQIHDCCRYLVMGTKGFECMKNTSMSTLLDKRVETETIVARGDNCEGKNILEFN